MEERQTNYTISEGYELPSGGAIYDKKINAHVELRSMTARDEMKRLNPSSTPLKTLADIIEGCMLEKPAVHVYDMALGDYEYLLHKLRIVTYGDDYKVSLTCPYCGEAVEVNTHLEDLELKEFNPNEFNNLRTFILPKSGKTVSLRFQTPHILDDIKTKSKELKRKFKEAEQDFETFTKLQSAIESVDGEVLNSFELENFIYRLPAMDMQKILQNIDKMNSCLGLNTELHVECPKCGQDILTFFRFGAEFFGPTID